MGWGSFKSRVPKLNNLKALNITVKQTVPGINFADKNFIFMGTGQKPILPLTNFDAILLADL